MKSCGPLSKKHSTRIRGRALVLLLSSAAAATFLAGCSSTKPPAPAPPALSLAEHTAAQAAKLSQAQNWPAAAREWRRAADRFSLLNDEAGEAVALHNLAQAQRELGKGEEARLLLESASAINQRLGRTNDWWRNQIALLQIESHHPETSPSRFATLLPKMTQLQDRSTRGLFLNELGLWQTQQTRFSDAEDSFAQADEQFRAVNDPSGRAAVQANQAQLKEEQKNYGEAARLWRVALDKFESLADAQGIARSLSGQGRSLLFAQTDLPRAEELLRRATHNFHLLRSPHEEAASRSLWVECRRAQGKPSPADAQEPEPGAE